MSWTDAIHFRLVRRTVIHRYSYPSERWTIWATKKYTYIHQQWQQKQQHRYADDYDVADDDDDTQQKNTSSTILFWMGYGQTPPRYWYLRRDFIWKWNLCRKFKTNHSGHSLGGWTNFKVSMNTNNNNNNNNDDNGIFCYWICVCVCVCGVGIIRVWSTTAAKSQASRSFQVRDENNKGIARMYMYICIRRAFYSDI